MKDFKNELQNKRFLVLVLCMVMALMGGVLTGISAAPCIGAVACSVCLAISHLTDSEFMKIFSVAINFVLSGYVVGFSLGSCQSLFSDKLPQHTNRSFFQIMANDSANVFGFILLLLSLWLGFIALIPATIVQDIKSIPILKVLLGFVNFS